jgi:sugar O-acyltransferase (sialic acid O-acetyltransferase NeuD family)
MRRIVVLGTGGNALDIADTVTALGPSADLELAGFLDDDPSVSGCMVLGHPVLGPLSSARTLAGCLFVNGIGNPENFRRKAEIIATTGVPPERFVTLVHPTASVSPSARLGRGVVLLQHVTVAARASIGDHVIVLPAAIVSHDVEVGDFSSVAGGACLSGRVHLGACSYVGSNASVRQEVRIGAGALIGMGAAVVDDVPPGEVWAGVPAQRIA